VAAALEHLDQHPAELDLIVDNQYPRHETLVTTIAYQNARRSVNETVHLYEPRAVCRRNLVVLAGTWVAPLSGKLPQEGIMCTKWTRATLLIVALAAPTAWADTNDDDGGSGKGADPAAKTLPAGASDTASANAFGQQGERTRLAHQAARAAAARAAHAAATQTHGQPTSLVRPGAAATAHASATGATNGFDRATAGATNGQGSTHRRQ
jgi:hypothetical protein